MLAVTLLIALSDPVAKPADPPMVHPLDKIECRRLDVTGSRVAAKRMCMSKREWNRAGSETRRELQNAIDRIPAKGVR